MTLCFTSILYLHTLYGNTKARDIVFTVCIHRIMYYSSRIRGQTVPQNLFPSYVCAISPDVAKSPPPTHRPQHRMSPPRRTPAASPPLSMESSSMAPNHGAEAPHESDAGARWRGLVLATLLPLVLGAQTRPMENESGGRGLAIMWPPFV